MYQLKNGQEGFEVVDGPDAGKRYRRGRTYPDVPAGYESRFEKTDNNKAEKNGLNHNKTGKNGSKPTDTATEMPAIAGISAAEKMPANGGHAKKEGAE